VRLVAFYLPQFHPIPENDAWWGKGFTEWRNVVRARPNFAGHYQPHVPADLGFYDLRLAETRDEQAALARRYGISAFCYYYYWFNGKRLLERPLLEMVSTGRPDMPFCVCWANENWSRRWDGGDQAVLMEQVYDEQGLERFIDDLLPVLGDARYLRVAGRPLLLVYRADLLPDAPRAAQVWRAAAQRKLGADLFLGAVQVGQVDDPRPLGFDAAIEFPPHNLVSTVVTERLKIVNPRFEGAVRDYISLARSALARPDPEYLLFRGVIPSWDNTPRLQNNSVSFVNAHPDNYRRWLSEVVKRTAARHDPEHRIVFVNAWNEWGEGCHLEPDLAFGHQYLEATREALQAANGA
jgi:lipopolysaccharide biosynthesis protein